MCSNPAFFAAPKIFNANFFGQRKLGTFAAIMNINLHRSGEQAGTQLTSIFEEKNTIQNKARTSIKTARSPFGF